MTPEQADRDRSDPHARAAYDAFTAERRSAAGRPIPTPRWDELAADQRAPWVAAAHAVRDLILKAEGAVVPTPTPPAQPLRQPTPDRDPPNSDDTGPAAPPQAPTRPAAATTPATPVAKKGQPQPQARTDSRRG